MAEQQSFNCILNQLAKSGLRITLPRKQLVEGLFGANAHRHITAEIFHIELQQKGVVISLATVYNTLHVLSSLGFLRKIKTSNYIIFDTDVTNHGHIVNELTGEVEDIKAHELQVICMQIARKNNLNLTNKDISVLISINK